LAEPIAAAALLAGQLAAIGWFLKGDVARWWPALAGTRYWRWCVKDLIGFGLPALIGLLLLGRSDALWAMPVEFGSMRAWLPWFGADAVWQMLAASVLGMAIGTAALALLARWRPGRRPFLLGKVDGLLPRSRGELLPAAVLSLSAGVTEELAFRLFLPLLLTVVTGEPAIGFALAAALFGWLHRYQGWIGVIATTVVGLVMSLVYLTTGQLWLAMLLHALIDLNALVIRPALTRTFNSSAATRS
jgi:membrane protease YdiL (CAAX protease family)